MKYDITISAVFLSRPNRFIAHVMIGEKEEIVHVKNTGRCRELLIKGAKVILEKGNNPNRKTKYSLIAVYKGNTLINMDSQAPNAVAAEALSAGKLQEIGIVDKSKREVPFGASRFDLFYKKGDKEGFLEVKGVTLEKEGVALFPDAPTERGAKHLRELITAVEKGYEASVLFLVQMRGVTSFRPNEEMDPDFALAFKEAKKAGVKILCYDCLVKENEMELYQPVKVEI